MEETAATDDPIVYLATVPNEPLARMWADVLADAGIRALVKALGGGIGGWGSAAMLEHELYVLRSQLPAAEAIVRDLAAEEAAETETEETTEMASGR